MESPQSSSITGYYKGFSVLLTKRDAEAKVRPLIDAAMEAVDYMIEKGFKPSWNDETNGKALGSVAVTSTPKAAPAVTTTASKPCPVPGHEGKRLFYNANGKFGPFWSHKTDQVKANGKPVYCSGVDETKNIPIDEYERVQSAPTMADF